MTKTFPPTAASLARRRSAFFCVSAITLSGALAIPYRYIGVPAKRMFCGVMSGAPAESIFGGVSLRCFPCLCENILAPESAFSTSAKRIFLCVSAVTLSGALTIPYRYCRLRSRFPFSLLVCVTACACLGEV